MNALSDSAKPYVKPCAGELKLNGPFLDWQQWLQSAERDAFFFAIFYHKPYPVQYALNQPSVGDTPQTAECSGAKTTQLQECL